MTTTLVIGYGLIAAAFAIGLAVNRDSWLSRRRGAGQGEPTLDFALAFLWGLVWPVTAVVWWLRRKRARE
jgi:hypothetical protein